MILQVFLVACVAAALGAPDPYGGYYAGNPYSAYPSQPAVATHSTNTYRSPFNTGQISTYSKALDTPFSSVRKSDIRVSNPGVAVGYGGYGGYAGYRPLAPLVSHVGVAAPYAHYGAPLASPYAHYGAPIAKVATTAGLLGVAYSAAPTVSHMSYSNGLGLAYNW